MRIDVLGVGFDNLTMEEAADAGMALLTGEGTHYVVTPNPEIVEVKTDTHLRQCDKFFPGSARCCRTVNSLNK